VIDQQPRRKRHDLAQRQHRRRRGVRHRLLPIGHAQQADPHAHERQVDDDQHQIADPHRCDHTPEQLPRNTPAHEVYDPAANRWTALAYVPTARDHLTAAAIDGRLYAVGGRIDGNYSRNLPSNEAYDPATNRWEQRAPMPTARSGIAAAVLEGRMFVFGGEAPAGTFNQVQAYDGRSNGWSNHARMPTARHGLGAAAVAGRIYVVSGGPTPGDSVSAANEIFVP